MTVAVGAGQGGSEVLMQTNVGRAIQHGSPGGQSAPEGKLQADDDVSAPLLKEGDANASVAKIEKPGRNRRGADKSGGDAASFQDTFAALGQDAVIDPAPLPSTDPVLLNMPIVQQSPQDAQPPSAPPAHVTSSIPQASVRATPMLKQASMLALMDAKDRLIANAGSDKYSTEPEQYVAPPDGPAERIKASVDQQETHWNFANNALMASRLAAPSLPDQAPSVAQSAAALLSSPATLQLTAGALPDQAPSATQSGAVLFSPATLQLAAGPLPDRASSVAAVMTSTSAPLTKVTGAEPQASSGAPTPAISSNDLPPILVAENPNNSFGDQDTPDGAPTTKQSLPDAAPQKVGTDDTASALDEIFSTAATNVQPQSAATNQVRAGIIAGLTSPDADQSPNIQQPVMPTRPAGPSMLRSLDLTLSPPDLGAVKIHMSLKDNALTIEAQASKASTAQMLNDGRTHLENGLRDAGYDVASVKITDASASASTNSNGWQSNGSQSRDTEQPRSSFSTRQDGDMQRRDGGSPSDQAQRRAKDPRPQTVTSEVTSGRLRNAVYI